MLKRLTVKNLALAEHAGVDFEPGLSVITGETGAGKSILIGALGLLLGERADTSMIRSGCDACWAEAVFDVSGIPGLNALLGEMGVPVCETGPLVVRRVVRTSGSQHWVNDASVTLATLRRIGACLVDMHGPHDHQSLFDPEVQRDILDAFGGTRPLREAYAATYEKHEALQVRRAAVEEAGGPDLAERIESLEARVAEIDAADLKDGEEEEIETEHRRVGNAQRILELMSGVSTGLSGDEGSVFTLLATMQRPLEELERLAPEAEEWRKEVTELTLRAQELAMGLQGFADRIEADPERLAWLDERLALYRKLKRKYGGDVADVREARQEAELRLEALRDRDVRLAELDRESAAAREAMEKAGRELRARRRKAASGMAEAITGELEFLGFPRSSFSVDVQPCPPQASGMDRVEFGFAPNVGEPQRPLRAIASSGEISRVMLATKAVLAEHDRVPVLVFDEIDANVGGEIGHAVGRELHGVARSRQVVCITHLPQVAVFGETHFAVTKEVRDGRTISRIERLNPAERVAEVARMLGGTQKKTATAHAAAMLKHPGSE